MTRYFQKRRAARKEKARREREARDERISRELWALCNIIYGRYKPYPKDEAPHA